MVVVVASRVLQSLGTLLLLSVVVFGVSRLTGDPRELLLPPETTQEDWDRMGRVLGLDKPVTEQYATFLGGALRGDLGYSFRAREPVIALIEDRIPASLRLGLLGMALVLFVGIPLGVVSAIYRGTIVDKFATLLALFGVSAPGFWVGIVLIEVFAVSLRWFPAGTDSEPSSVVLPAITVALFGIAGLTRLTRSGMLETLDTEYVKLARAKGLSESTVVWKHAFRNALIPVVTFAGVILVNLVTLGIVVETVFAWPGLGRLTYVAILTRDFPLVQGLVLTIGASAAFVNLLVDILYVYIDPRIRYR
jgi:peptide/nickel transport system permease protein